MRYNVLYVIFLELMEYLEILINSKVYKKERICVYVKVYPGMNLKGILLVKCQSSSQPNPGIHKQGHEQTNHCILSTWSSTASTQLIPCLLLGLSKLN